MPACGGDDKGGGGGSFDVSGKVDHFAGPTPLIVRFTATSKNADGDVLYRWRFDDGTSSQEQNLTHTFPRAGYYQVILDARDESGNNDRETFLFGAWPPTQWAKAQRTPLTKKGALRRTEGPAGAHRRAPRGAPQASCAERAREQIEG